SYHPETTHLTATSSCEALVLAMFDAKAHLHPRSAVRTELVRDHDARRCDGGFQELPYEPLRSTTVSSTLDQDVENEAILIDRAPKPVLLATDRHRDFIHMPFVAASRRALADLIGERLAELLPPLAHGLVRHANPARRQHFLDHTKAQRKPEIQPNGIADDFRRKAMAAIQRVTGSRHGRRLALANSQLVNVTMPSNNLRKRSLSRKRPWRFFEKVE